MYHCLVIQLSFPFGCLLCKTEMQVCTQKLGRRPFGVGLILIGHDVSHLASLVCVMRDRLLLSTRTKRKAIQLRAYPSFISIEPYCYLTHGMITGERAACVPGDAIRHDTRLQGHVHRCSLTVCSHLSREEHCCYQCFRRYVAYTHSRDLTLG